MPFLLTLIAYSIRAGHLERGYLEYPQKKHLLSTVADVAGKSEAGKSSRVFAGSGTAAVTDKPTGTEYSSEFFWAVSRALA